MDTHHFDTLTKQLSRTPSRRRLLQLWSGVLAGGTVAAVARVTGTEAAGQFPSPGEFCILEGGSCDPTNNQCCRGKAHNCTDIGTGGGFVCQPKKIRKIGHI